MYILKRDKSNTGLALYKTGVSTPFVTLLILKENHTRLPVNVVYF